MTHLWVVEVKDRDKWYPTVCARLSKEEARGERREWFKKNPTDKFRVTKYVRAT